MVELSEQLLIDLSVISKKDPPEVRSLYRAAAEQLDLQVIDYLTIRDLVRLSGRRDVTLHLILIAMFLARSQGSVCLILKTESLMKKLGPIIGDGMAAGIPSIPDKIAGYPELVYVRDRTAPPLLTTPQDEYKPLILVTDGVTRRLYFQKYFAAEQAVTGAIRAALDRDRALLQDGDRARELFREILEDNPAEAAGAPALLNTEQKLGILLPLLKNFVLISGGPGTGKTFIVFSLARLLVRLGIAAERIKIAAPTGRAAQKLTDAFGRGLASLRNPDPDRELSTLQAATIHRLLRYSPARNNFFFNRYNRIPADMIIIDEASMIDIVLLGRLFEALEDDACIVLLGDRNQLPSVEAGAVLADLIPERRDISFTRATAGVIRSVYPDLAPEYAVSAREPAGDPLADRAVILRESYRSEESIKRISAAINSRDAAVLDDIAELDPRRGFPESGVWRIEPADSGPQYRQEIRQVITSWARHHYVGKAAGGVSYHELAAAAAGRDYAPGGEAAAEYLPRLFARLDDARILTPLRSGLSGTAGINGHLAGTLGGIFDPFGRGGIFSGAPIIIGRNDYSRELFNGDVGVILPGPDAGYYCLFPRPGGFARHPVEALPPHELSFAITVHKSQGSEYGAVLLILPEGTPSGLLTKEIIYTAVTRAKNLVVIYAKKKTIREAVHNSADRESGISLQ